MNLKTDILYNLELNNFDVNQDSGLKFIVTIWTNHHDDATPPPPPYEFDNVEALNKFLRGCVVEFAPYNISVKYETEITLMNRREKE